MRSGTSVVDGVMVAVAAALLPAVPLTDRAAWLPWALVVVLALTLGVAVLRLLAAASGWSAVAVFAALSVPVSGLAAVDAALGSPTPWRTSSGCSPAGSAPSDRTDGPGVTPDRRRIAVRVPSAPAGKAHGCPKVTCCTAPRRSCRPT